MLFSVFTSKDLHPVVRITVEKQSMPLNCIFSKGHYKIKPNEHMYHMREQLYKHCAFPQNTAWL